MPWFARRNSAVALDARSLEEKQVVPDVSVFIAGASQCTMPTHHKNQESGRFIWLIALGNKKPASSDAGREEETSERYAQRRAACSPKHTRWWFSATQHDESRRAIVSRTSIQPQHKLAQKVYLQCRNTALCHCSQTEPPIPMSVNGGMVAKQARISSGAFHHRRCIVQ